MKPDALSCQFVPDVEAEEKKKPIVPATSIVGLLTWEIERLIREAQQEPDPGLGPTGQLYISTTVREKVIHLAHTVKFNYKLPPMSVLVAVSC